MGAKKLYITLLFLIASMLLISLASAEIMISQQKSIYSLGDEMAAEIKLSAIESGYLDVNLICDGSTASIYHNVPDSKTITIKRALTPEYIQNLKGICYVSASYADENENGQNFQVSSSVDVEIKSANLTAKVGETVKIEGVAYLKNGQLTGQIYPAFVEVSVIDSVGSTNITKSDVVNDGQFSLELYIPEATHAGGKAVSVKVYDKDKEGNVLNSGESTITLEIKQEPAKISIALDKLLISPGENVTIIPFLYDKAGDPISGKVDVKILNSKNKSIFSGSLNANQEFVFSTNTTNIPGAENVVAEKDSLTGEKSFQISELKKVSAEISGDILTVTNVGNVAYNDNVEVKIGNQTIAEYVELDYGEKIEYRISAPDGSYAITVKETSSNLDLLSQNGISLTGNAISMKEVGIRIDNIFAQYPIVWIFILVVLAVFIWVYYHKHIEQRRIPSIMAGMRGDKNKVYDLRKKGGVEIIKPERRDERIDEITLSGGIKRAEQVLVLQGQKQPAGIIAIKLKNGLKGIAQQSFNNALENAYRAKAVSHLSGDTVLLIFSPLLTKTFKNDETAIKAAQAIDDALKTHNKKFRNDTIDYGIGVNSGDIVNKIEGKTLQFSSIGKTIGLAKKIADLASQEVFLSKEIHEKTMNTVKTEKVATGAMDLFTITRVVNSEQSAKFINEFLRRNK